MESRTAMNKIPGTTKITKVTKQITKKKHSYLCFVVFVSFVVEPFLS